MALAFVVETGDADPDATSYVSVEFADDYIGVNIHASADWLALDTGDRENLLMRSSKYLDRMVRWEGERVDEDSGLRWPRSGVYDIDNFLIPDDVIPEALQEATAELAAYLMSSDWTQLESGRGLKEIQVDVIELKFETDFTRGSIPAHVMAILEGLGDINTGRRPAFKKIVRH